MARKDEFTATTRDIRVSVRAFYLADQSEPDRGQFVWAYRVEIANVGRETVQLMRRTWHITDGLGRTQTVHGAGVIGEQPVLEPGGRFEYTSGTPLATASGFTMDSVRSIAIGLVSLKEDRGGAPRGPALQRGPPAGRAVAARPGRRQYRPCCLVM